MDYIPLNAVRAFESAARHLSFSAAGEELHVTHPAISHQIRRLEEWLGVALFHRDARKVRLTEAGVTLQISASGALAELGATCRRIRRNAGQETLSVGCIPSIASRWLVPLPPSTKKSDFSTSASCLVNMVSLSERYGRRPRTFDMDTEPVFLDC